MRTAHPSENGALLVMDVQHEVVAVRPEMPEASAPAPEGRRSTLLT